MTYRRTRLPEMLLLLLILSVIGSMTAASGPPDRLTVDVDPAQMPQVSLSVTREPLDVVLGQLCQQAGWGLVLPVAADALSTPVTVVLPAPVSADQLVRMLLTDTPLSASLQAGILRVSLSTSGASPEGSEGDRNVADDRSPGSTERTIVIDDLSDVRRLNREYRHKWKEWRKAARNDGDAKRVEIGESVHVAPDEQVTGAVSVGRNTIVEGVVVDDAVAVGGDVVLRSGARVGRDAVAVGGDVVVEDGAVVDGEAVAIGGRVRVAAEGRVRGDRVSVRLPGPGLRHLPDLLRWGGMFRIVGRILRTVVLLGIALLLLWWFPDRVVTARSALDRRPIKSLFAGVLLALGFIPLLLLALLSIVGIPMIPFILLFGLGVVLFGWTALFSWLGQRILARRQGTSTAVALCLGGLVFLVLHLIPVVGCVVSLLGTFMAAGAVFLSRFGSRAP